MISISFTKNAWWMERKILIPPMIIMRVEQLVFTLWYYISCRCNNKINLYPRITLPKYLCPITYELHFQMKLPKYILVQTWERNRKWECLQYMYRSLIQVWGHIRNDILRGGKMGIVQTHRYCFIYKLYVI